MTIPIPPYREQLRIVEEAKKWLMVIDGLDVEIEDLQTSIAQAKSKILDLAIHGRLVPQDPNDEPAIELLKRINPKFTPCDNAHYENVPSGWTVCRLSDICEITMGSSSNGDSLNKQKNGVEFHQGKISFTDKYLSLSNVYTTEPIRMANANSVLLCVRAPVGIINITSRPICIGRGLCALNPKNGVNRMFLFYALQTHKEHFEERATGTTFKAIGGDVIKNEIFILPPTNVQERIVKAIERYYAVLDNISAEL